ncbi:hypothetical protein [Paludibaculum fermentans]|uniref:Glycosyltransferase RgtA/B/C/D-like domain-containing protein n=1 Tax=Paludibaculum fermentans TaxID=1473598 RepID=A0A7S7NKN9_PALFE|nr:hypothetical protein [Paludibaculum fermentans]QOY85362.1 hypothetical protein IRI77_21310 [Paludibaculum fermentans]
MRAPLVAISSFLLCLMPGLFLAFATGAATRLDRWVLSGFGLSLAGVSLCAGIAQSFLSQPLAGVGFFALLIGLAAVSFGVAWLRAGDPAQAPEWSRADTESVLLTVMVLWCCLAALVPKIYWEAFHPDGHQVLETSRRLLFHALPFWPPESGDASFPGFTTMLFAFPGSWFVRIFGDSEASARLPLFLYLLVLFFGVLASVTRRIGRPGQILIWIALVIYLVVAGYSITYNPYHADLASPATQDTLFVVCFLGFALAYCQRAYGSLVLWTAALYTCWPTGAMLACLWCAATLVAWKEKPRNQVVATAVVLAACMITTRILGHFLPSLGVPQPGGEHGWSALLEERLNVYQIGAMLRLRFVWDTLFLQRWWWVVVPAGILPFGSLALWRRQDELSRAVTLTTLAYFLFFYTQALVHIHYFVPVMLLPLVVFWRMEPDDVPRRRRFYMATAAAAAVAMILSWPERTGVYVTTRSIGSSIECLIPGYDWQEPRVYKGFQLMAQAIPDGWAEGVPERRFGVLPSVWAYYAHRSRVPGVPINYILTDQTAAVPPLSSLLASDGEAALYVRSREVMESQRGLRLVDRAGSSIYQAPRWTMLKKKQLLSETWAEIRRRLGF